MPGRAGDEEDARRPGRRALITICKRDQANQHSIRTNRTSRPMIHRFPRLINSRTPTNNYFRCLFVSDDDYFKKYVENEENIKETRLYFSIRVYYFAAKRESVFKHTMRRAGKRNETRKAVSPSTRVIFVKDRREKLQMVVLHRTVLHTDLDPRFPPRRGLIV